MEIGKLLEKTGIDLRMYWDINDLDYWIEDNVWNNTERQTLALLSIGMFFMIIGPFFPISVS